MHESPVQLPSLVPVMALTGIALFPGALLPLRIFEPRYREMLAAVPSPEFPIRPLSATSQPSTSCTIRSPRSKSLPKRISRRASRSSLPRCATNGRIPAVDRRRPTRKPA